MCLAQHSTLVIILSGIALWCCGQDGDLPLKTFSWCESSSVCGIICMSAGTRLFKELKEVSRASKTDSGIDLKPDENNIYAWKGLLQGPKDTPFEGGVFEVVLKVPQQYPLVPPAVRFKTKIFHPNVHFKTGEICLDILKTAWSPAWTLQSVCQAIIALMSDSAPDSPLNCDAGNLLRANDVRGYNSLARLYTTEHAMTSKS